MNWSKEWGKPDDEPKPVSEWASKSADHRSDAQKIVDDHIMYGRSFSQDGKHVPLENVYEQYKTRNITTHSGKQINVTVVGDLGLDFDEDGWNIYHLPTRAAFDKAVPHCYKHQQQCIDNIYGEVCNCLGGPKISYSYDKQPLLNWMAKVQFPVDGCYEVGVSNYTGKAIRNSWEALRQLTKDDYFDKGETAKNIIQKWCLSVKVE